MPVSVSLPAQTQAPTSRLATAIVRGASIPVSCPSWCSTDHAAESLRFIEDLSHEGEPIALPVPRHGGPEEPVLRARLCQWPFAERSAPFLALEAADDGDCAELPPAAAIAYTDQIVAHAAAIRGLATTLKEVA